LAARRENRGLVHRALRGGFATDGCYLYAIEDVKENGCLLRYDPDTRELAVLRSGLIEGEAIAVCPDGSVFYAEKGRNRVGRLQADEPDQVMRKNLNKPGFLFCDSEGLWITEDAVTHDAWLMLLGPDGGLRVIARGLRAVQTFLPLGNDRFLLADQGWNRILEFERLPR
jgi:sugar lactone lactonase YvrE